MTILLGIIVFHMLVLIRSKMSSGEEAPYFSTFIISLLLVGFVVYMMFTMEEPGP